VKQPPRSKSSLQLCGLLLVCLVGWGCAEPPPSRTCLLLDQVDAAEAAGPWRNLGGDRINIDWSRQTSGLVIEQKGKQVESTGQGRGKTLKKLMKGRREMVQTEPVSSIRLDTALRAGEKALLRLTYKRSWSEVGHVEVLLLDDGQALVRKKVPMKGSVVEMGLAVPTSGTDLLEIRHHLDPGTKINLKNIGLLALGDAEDGAGEVRARALQRLASDDRQTFFRGALDHRRIRIARDGCSRDAVVLAGGDTIEFTLPETGVEGTFTFWFVLPTGAADGKNLIRMEALGGGGWEPVGEWGVDGKGGAWREVVLQPGSLPGQCSAIRFGVADEEILVGLAEPLILPLRGTKGDLQNLILIDLDTLRADRLQCYGYDKRPTSAMLDPLLAKKGFSLFKNAYSASPWTIPATAKFLASRYQDFHQGDRQISLDHVMLPEVLREHGYYCAAFTGGGMMGVSGMGQGFVEYHTRGSFGKIEDSFPPAREWLKEWAGGPFCLFLHTYETHRPLTRGTFCGGLPRGRLGDLTSGEALLTKRVTTSSEFSPQELDYIKAAYDGSVRTATDAVADLFQLMEELDLWRNSVVVILSDHGEEFWDHFPVFGAHGHSLYSELLDVPFLVYAPGLRQRGLGVIKEPVSTVDLLPTVVDLLGLDWQGHTDGVSVRPLMAGEEFERTIPILAGMQGPGIHPESLPRVCIIEDGYKYIERVGPKSSKNQPKERWKYYPDQDELYSLSDDPHEQQDLRRSDFTRWNRMRESLLRALDRTKPAETSAQGLRSEAPPENLDQQLQALGYIE